MFKNDKSKISYMTAVVLGLALLVSLGFIVVINLFHVFNGFNADIASENVLARVIWDTKSLIPNGWYPSTETRIIATPNLSSLFYGLTGDMNLAMGIDCASSG